MDSDNFDALLIKQLNLLNAMKRDRGLLGNIALAREAILTVVSNGRCIFTAGNGGSAADAQHIAAEFTGRFQVDRKALPAICLADNPAQVTAIANDYGYSEVFARPLRALARAGDICLLLSTSGESESVLRAAETCTELGLTSVAFTGNSHSKLLGMADIPLQIPHSETARIQEMHKLLCHYFCSEVDKSLPKT